MRKLLVLLGLAGVLAILGMVAVPSTSPAAKGGNACPKDEREPPNCGKNDNQPNCNENNQNRSPHCGQEEEEEEAGLCESADLVLLTEDAQIICLYGPDNAAKAEEECGGGTVLGGEGSPGAICLLPSEETAAA